MYIFYYRLLTGRLEPTSGIITLNQQLKIGIYDQHFEVRHMHLYIYMYIYLYKYIWMYVYTDMYAGEYVYEYLYLYIFLYNLTNIFKHIQDLLPNDMTPIKYLIKEYENTSLLCIFL
jgi:hypothetical protein